MKIHVNIPEDIVPHYSGTQGFYSSVQLMPKSKHKLNRFCIASGLGELDVDGHCTIMYSSNSIDPKDAKIFRRDRYWARAIELTWWKGELDNIGYVVLRLISPGLDEEHCRLRQLGCVPDYETYNPHVTLISDIDFKSDAAQKLYCAKANTLIQREPIELVFGHQIVEDLK